MFTEADVGKYVKCHYVLGSDLTVDKFYKILYYKKCDNTLSVVDDKGQRIYYVADIFEIPQENILQQILSITEEHPEIEVIVSQGMFSVDYCSDSHHRIIKLGCLQDTLECVKLMKQWLEVEVALKELEEK